MHPPTPSDQNLQETRLPTGSGALLDREAELALLEKAVIDAKASESQLVVIEGPAGIGKSRLLLEAREMAEKAGFVNVVSRGNEFEREYAFGVVRQMIASALRASGENLVGSEAAVAREMLLELTGGGGSEGESTTFTIFENLYWSTVKAAESTPVMICVDDLQWCDRQSIDYVTYLTRRIEGLPIIVIVSVRPTEVGAAAPSIREVLGDPRRVTVKPKPLGISGIAGLTEQRLGSAPAAEFSNELEVITGGNPLLLDELLKELDAENVTPDEGSLKLLREIGPRAASRSVLLRLARLDPNCAVVVRALAVLGNQISAETLVGFTGLSGTEVATALADLSRAEILRPEEPIAFVHPLVREAIYRDIPPGEREMMHIHAAKQLSELNSPLERVAAQLVHVRPRGDDWVVAKLRAAGAHAMETGAMSSTVVYLKRAMEEPPAPELRGEILRDLGFAQALSSDIEGADSLLKAYELTDDPVQRAFIASINIRLLGFASRNKEALKLADEVLAEIAGNDDPQVVLLRERIEAARYSIATINPNVLEWSALDPLINDTRERGDNVEGRMMDGTAAYAKMMIARPAEEFVEMAMRAVENEDLLRFDNGGFSLVGALVALTVADDPRAIEVANRSLEYASRGGPVYAPAVARGFKGMALAWRGDLQGAYENIELAREDIELFDLRLGHIQAAAMLCNTGVESGELARAERDLKRGEGYLRDDVQTALFYGAKLALQVEQGRNREALATCDLLTGLISPEQMRNPGWIPWRSLRAEALDGLSRTEEAIPLVEDELEDARRVGAPRALGRSLRVLGQLKRKDGHELIEESVAVLADSPARLEYGWSLAALGTSLRHARKTSEAREPLSEALGIAQRASAIGLERHVREELAAAGAAPRATDFQGMDALTPSERRVAGLAVEGMTNREIAQALFVTPKTVEVHLSNVYKKLDVKSRKDLPAVFVPEAA